MTLKYEEISEKIIGAFYNVYNALGYGFLEKVYENAFMVELTKSGLSCLKQVPIKVYYEGVTVGEYFADIVVEDVIILELKATEELHEEHEFQIINYLKATDIEVGYLFNFGKRPHFKRKIFSNSRKSL